MPPHDRRGFLRGLLALPLIGGGVTLIGSPSAVAEPVTTALLAGYAEWLSRESLMAVAELEDRSYLPAEREQIEYHRRWLYATRKVNPLPLPSGMNLSVAGPASTRAALVLSAVGADWREDGR